MSVPSYLYVHKDNKWSTVKRTSTFKQVTQTLNTFLKLDGASALQSLIIAILTKFVNNIYSSVFLWNLQGYGKQITFRSPFWMERDNNQEAAEHAVNALYLLNMQRVPNN